MRAQAEIVGIAVVGALLFFFFLFFRFPSPDPIPSSSSVDFALFAMVRAEVVCQGELMQVSEFARCVGECPCRDVALEGLVEAATQSPHVFELRHDGAIVFESGDGGCEPRSSLVIPDKALVEVWLGICESALS